MWVGYTAAFMLLLCFIREFPQMWDRTDDQTCICPWRMIPKMQWNNHSTSCNKSQYTLPSYFPCQPLLTVTHLILLGTDATILAQIHRETFRPCSLMTPFSCPFCSEMFDISLHPVHLCSTQNWCRQCGCPDRIQHNHSILVWCDQIMSCQ